MEKVLGIFVLSFTLAFADFAVSSVQELRTKDVIRQTYEESCGAAALATLLNLLDSTKFSELDILQHFTSEEAKINTNMVSFAELEKAVISLQYQVKSYKIERDSFEKIYVPMLVKIEDDPRFPHFVVVINHVGDYVSIFDPSFGVYTNTKEEFFSVWDRYYKGGYALIVKPKTQNLKEYNPVFPNQRLVDKDRIKPF